MTDYRKILRLYHEGFSQRSTATICKSSRNTVRNTISRFEESSLSWPLPESLDDAELESILLGKKVVANPRKSPDFKRIHQELSKSGVTLSLLWHEYLADCQSAGEAPYMYSQFCELYRKFSLKEKATMHIPRNPGEAMKVDWARDRGIQLFLCNSAYFG